MKEEKKDVKRIILPPNRARTELALGNFDPIGRATDNKHGDGAGRDNSGSPTQKEKKESGKN